MIASHVIDNRKVAIMDWNEYEQLKAKAEQNNFSELAGVTWNMTEFKDHINVSRQVAEAMLLYDQYWSKQFAPYISKDGKSYTLIAQPIMQLYAKHQMAILSAARATAREIDRK